MKKLLITSFILAIMSGIPATCKVDHEKLYNDTEVPDIKLMHNLDPYQAEEYLTYAYAPIALFRTATHLYFKEITIPPGYYLLAARNIDGKDYIFFKEAGKVKFIIPVIETETVLEDFYQRKMPVPELTKWQKFKRNMSEKFYKKFDDSKKQPPPSFYVETQKLDSNFYSIIYYYDNKKYTMYFRTTSF